MPERSARRRSSARTPRFARHSGLARRLLICCTIAWLALSSLAIASEYHGQVTFGGVPVPGTTVTVTATQGSKKVVAVTDTQGVFTFPDLADGAWTLTIEMTGFAPIKQDITIAPNAAPGVFEMKLLSLDQIRAASKPVKIDVAAPTVAVSVPAPQPGSPAAGTPAATAKAAAAKPQTATTAAAAPTAAPPETASAPATPDGLLINGSVNNAATSQFSLAQAFGNTRNSRSLYNGGFSLVLDSSSLDARSYPLSGVESPKPDYNNITAGFNFGGPIKIPHLLIHGPDFFVFYQRTQRTSENTDTVLVPSQAQQYGDLTPAYQAGYLAGRAITGAIYDPNHPGQTYGATNCSPLLAAIDPTPTACIPNSELTSQAQALLGYYPLPNISSPTSPYNYQIVVPGSTHQDVFQTQLRKQIGSKNNVYGFFALQDSRSSNISVFNFLDTTDSLGMNTNANWYHRFTQRLSSTATYTFSRSRSRLTPFFANRINVEGLAGITGADTAAPYWAPPSLSFSQSGIAGLGDATTSNNRGETNALTFQMYWNRLRHNITAGGDFRRQETNNFNEANPQGQFSFTGAATQYNGAGGSDFVDFLIGIPDTSSIAYGNADKYLRQSVYDAYFTDDFRVNPELSINAGFRWEYGAPVTELKNRLVNLDVAPGFTTEAPVLASNPLGSLSGQTYPTSLVRPDRLGLEPRIGIAWRPISGSSLLVRSGYGIYDDTSVYLATALAMAQQAPLSTSLSVQNSAACPLTLAKGFLPCAAISPDTFAVNPGFRVGYAQVWQLSAQRDLPGSLQMVATYLGVKGTRGVEEFLPNTYAPGGTNPCPSCTSGYVYRTSGGNSTREAGSLQLRRRLRSGFTASLLYTYSKSLDDDYSLGGQGPVSAGAIGGGSSLSGQVAQDWQDLTAQRGLSTFDQRHLLTASAQYTTGMGIGGHTLLSGWRGAAYKEWTFLTNITVGSGLPETPIDPAAIGGSGSSGIRANVTGQPIHSSSTPGVYLNSAAFTLPAPGQWGDARRDSITGPDQFSLNASMARTFRLHDRYNLDARIDSSNALNHVTFGSFNTTVSSNNTLFGTHAGPNGMRSVTITLRLRF
ncbi:MAG: carboxypeptidase-like regulatory domain-containing protein [Acidobacteriaceae bacterium]|jgi:hypothetical protein